MFFRLILLFFLVYFILRFIQSFFRPNRQTGQSQQSGYYDHHNRKEGDTVVDPGDGKKDKKISKNEGEYIDYEDV